MAYTAPAGFSLDGADPRLHHENLQPGDEKHAKRSSVVPFGSEGEIPLEAYLYWGDVKRQIDRVNNKSGNKTNTKFSQLRSKLNGGSGKEVENENPETDTNIDTEDTMPQFPEWDLDGDRMQAERALRSASWQAVFYLITTDILGPSSAPWAFSQLGYVTGVLMFFFMGVAAAYTGWQLWTMFMNLDSYKHPVRNYSDISYRVYGRWAQHVVNSLQTVQLLFNVSVIILGNGQGLAEISKNRVCFSILTMIWALSGMFIGQIRSLKNFGWLANFAVWLNLLVIVLTMGVVAHSAPNFTAASMENAVTGHTVISKAFIHGPVNTQIVGIMQIVYSYGGAMMFVEFMAEMKRPMDFWKAMACAQTLICVCYMFFGIFVYHYQGQFTINPGNQGISIYGWQTATNIISLLSALIAAGLYGNIGIKVIYQNVILDMLKGPEMESRKGRYLWTVMVIVYWCVAYVVAGSVPQFSNISGLVAAVCILQFSYTFPPILMLGFDMQKDALQGEKPYDPITGATHRIDTWRDLSRWRRAFSKHWYVKTFNFLFFLAALATAGLGIYSSVQGIIDGFNQSGAATSFGCSAPV